MKKNQNTFLSHLLDLALGNNTKLLTPAITRMLELKDTLANNSSNRIQQWELLDRKTRSLRKKTLIPSLFPTE
jgi:hypothetical protein